MDGWVNGSRGKIRRGPCVGSIVRNHSGHLVVDISLLNRRRDVPRRKK